MKKTFLTLLFGSLIFANVSGDSLAGEAVCSKNTPTELLNNCIAFEHPWSSQMTPGLYTGPVKNGKMDGVGEFTKVNKAKIISKFSQNYPSGWSIVKRNGMTEHVLYERGIPKAGRIVKITNGRVTGEAITFTVGGASEALGKIELKDGRVFWGNFN